MGRVLTRSMTRALAMAKVENCEKILAPPQPRASSSSSSSSSCYPSNDGDGSVRLDARLWRRLPEHLMELVLAHLPIPSLFRLRSVCSAWRALAASPTFLALHNDVSNSRPPSSWFYVYRNQDYREASTFDPALNRWIDVTPPALGLGLGPDCDTRMVLPIASAGGLVCFSSSTAGGRTSLIVTNPVTKAWRELPPMLRIQTYRMASMTVDPRIRAYKIVVVGFYGILDAFHPTTEVFSSATNAWTISGDIPRCPLFPSRRSVIAGCEGVLYSWCCDPPDGLLAFDLDKGAWSQIHAPIRHPLDSHVLVEWKGTIYTISGVRSHTARTRNGGGVGAGGNSSYNNNNNNNNSGGSICVWELDKEESEWRKVDRMPEILCEEFLAGGKRFVCIAGADGLVLLVVRSKDRLALLYDLDRRVWRRLPSCPVADHRMRYGLIGGIAYEPRLDVDAMV